MKGSATSNEINSRPMRSGYRPLQVIPESEKTESWIMDNMDWCIAQCPAYHRSKVDELYDRYNGRRDSRKFDHLTKTFGPEFPINKVKHFPLVRPLLNELQGEYEELGNDFTVFAVDNDTLETKYNQIKVQLLDAITQAIKEGADIDETLDGLQKHYKEGYQTSLEKSVWQSMYSYFQRNHLDREFAKNFIDKMITGAEYYQVRINRIQEDPDYYAIRPGDLHYADNKVDWVRDTDWAVHPVLMSPNQVLDEYGEYMTDKQKTEVANWIEMYSNDHVKFRDEFHPDRIINSEQDLNLAKNYENNLIQVWKVEYKSERRIDYKESPNKYDPATPFIKMLSQEDLIEIKQTSRRKELRVRYIQDRYSGVRIGDNTYIKMGKDKYPVRNPAKPSKVYLTYNGPTFANGVEPYSLIGITDDLQDTYDILHFHRENLLALSGVKGSYMDVSQMPDFETGNLTDNLKMFMYYKKLGVAFIDSSREKAGSYNQFGTYDDTLGQGYASILAAISNIEETAGRLVGVNRQRLGNTSYRDGKAVSEDARVQASLVTQGMFNEHYEFTRMAMEDIINAMRVAYKDGYTSSFVSDKYLQNIFTLDGDWSISYFNVFVSNKYSEKRTVEEMKSFALQTMREGLMEFQDIIPLFRKGNLSDVLTHIEQSISKKRDKVAQQEAQMQQMEAQLSTAEAQGKVALVQTQIEKLRNDIEDNKQKIALQEKSLNDDRINDMMKAQNDAARVALEAKQLDMETLSNNNRSEVRNR